MQSTTRICPGVITVVQIIQTSTIARDRANFPIVPAEMKRLRGRERDGSGALNNVHGNDAAARRRSHIHRRSWTIDVAPAPGGGVVDRKSTRLNSSHVRISYAVFCLDKKHVP